MEPRKPLMPLENAYAMGSKLEMNPMAVRSMPRLASFSMMGFT